MWRRTVIFNFSLIAVIVRAMILIIRWNPVTQVLIVSTVLLLVFASNEGGLWVIVLDRARSLTKDEYGIIYANCHSVRHINGLRRLREFHFVCDYLRYVS